MFKYQKTQATADKFDAGNVLFGIAPKEPKKYSPLKPVSPRKPKFPAIAQGHESRYTVLIQ
jgi:hypothetical protein